MNPSKSLPGMSALTSFRFTGDLLRELGQAKGSSQS